MNGNAFGWGFAIAVPWFGLASPAAAETCATDRDCIEAGAACGTEVCTHPSSPNATTGECMALTNTFSSYCDKDTDCKCHSLGATCVPPVYAEIFYPPYCSFTTPDGAAPALPDRTPDGGAPPIDGGAGAEGAGDNDPSAGDAAISGLPPDATDEASTDIPGASSGSAGSSSSSGSSGCGCVMGPAGPVSWAVPAGLLGVALALGRRRRPG
jgi:MYXO-CTERM domain-containing protein